jgi:hypothetical protein
MKISVFITFLFLFVSGFTHAQNKGFPFGKVTYKDLGLKEYERDTSAGAVVLYESGEAYFESQNDYNLIFKHHTKIKILKKHGLSVANFEIPLYKQDSRFERLMSVKASAFNIENGSMKETPLDSKNVFTENPSKYYDLKKLAIPNVRVGSVIEIEYQIASPFIFNFRTWNFQSELPKMYSEYDALIPGNYVYNMVIKGYLKLSTNDGEEVRDCFSTHAGTSNCAHYKFAMKDIPAFIPEDYMTAKSNFISSMNFELSEIKYFDGRVDKVTKEWKDAEIELKKEERFGGQLRRGKDIGDQIERLVVGVTDSLSKAKKVYNFIKDWYQWDNIYWKYSEFGIRKAFDKKLGNIGDINLSLIAALRYADLDVEPVILSTRDNGLPIELHPVLSDFNYVIAKVNIGKKSYLVDASDDFCPFGILPERCLNGKGRALGEDASYWVDLKPSNKSKKMSVVMLKLDKSGAMTGTLQNTFIGYEAIDMRKKIYSYSDTEEYIKHLKSKSSGIEIKNVQLTNVEDIELPLIVKMEIEINDLNGDNFLFNPFIGNQWKENPFKSQERLYPVDFGPPLEDITLVTIQYPQDFEVVSLPEKAGLQLPNGGGRYIVDAKNVDGTLTISNSLLIAKPVFSSEEYHYLKELFNRVVQVHNTDLLFKRKGL